VPNLERERPSAALGSVHKLAGITSNEWNPIRNTQTAIAKVPIEWVYDLGVHGPTGAGFGLLPRF
jgi:hypothetical protein